MGTVAQVEATDNPVRIARVTKGWTAQEFAEAVGISRPALAAIEDGRTNEPREVVTGNMDEVFGVPAGTMKRQLAIWRAKRTAAGPILTPVQAAILTLSPYELSTRFDSFQAWREVFGTRNGFARMLGINHAFVRNYELGVRTTPGMSETIQRGLLTVLKVSPDYLAALVRLQPGKDD